MGVPLRLVVMITRNKIKMRVWWERWGMVRQLQGGSGE